MNQILYTIENEQEKNRMKSITLFFGIVIIIFGILLVATGGYSIASANKAKQEAIEAAKIPVIELSVEENKAIVNISHSREIKKIEYYWNDGEVITVNKEGKKNISEEIDLPAGKNTLNVKAFDIEGKTSNITQEFSYQGTYMDLSVVDNKSLKILVTDVEGLQSVTYKWNSGEETTAYPDTPNSTSIEITTNIPIGLNTIVVTSINNKNITQTKEMQVQGITKPTMDIDLNPERTLISIKFKDDQGIQSYSYKVSSAPIEEIVKDGKLLPNAKEKLKETISQTKQANGEKEIIEQITCNEGFNYVEVTIINIEGAEETLTGWCAK